MAKIPQFELRDFLYLDTSKVQSFASVIQGGLATEISQKIKELGEISGGISAGIMSVSAKLGTARNRENEQIQTMQITDTVLFDGVYRALKEKESDKLITIKEANLDARQKLRSRQFIEIDGKSSPPVLESWIEQMKSMLNFLEKYSEIADKMSITPQGQSPQIPKQPHMLRQVKQFKAIVDLLEQYIDETREDKGRQYVRIKPSAKQFNVWCGLLPRFVLVPYADFGTEVTIVGQIERLLNEEEVWKLADLSKFGNPQAANTLLSALNSMPMGLKQLTEEDLQAKYPDVFIRPIAIYR